MNHFELENKFIFNNDLSSRYNHYQMTKNDYFNNNILNLYYKNLGKWEHRNSLVSNLEKKYGESVLFKEIFLIMDQTNRNFNLKMNSDEHDVNLFTDLKFHLSKKLNIDDYFIIFTIYKDNKIFIRLSTLGIIALNGVIECIDETGDWRVYNIPLFSMFEKHYWNIDDIDKNDTSGVNIEITYKKRNLNSSYILPEDIMLSCKAAHVNTWKIIGNNYANTKYKKNINFDEFIMTEKINISEFDNNISEIESVHGLSPLFYIANYHTKEKNDNGVNINYFEINNYKIVNNSSRIVNDEINNIVSCWFFPTNGNGFDLIKKEKVFGYNFAVGDNKIILGFDNIPNGKLLIGYFQFRLLIYKNNNCRII